MKIAEFTENEDYYIFRFDDGAKCSVGKQSESNPNGAADCDEAIEILLMNYPDLEL